MRTESEFRALVVLLGDDQEHVASVARDALALAREAALPYLEDAARSPDPVLRGRARLLLEELKRGAIEEEWRRFAELPDSELDLETGCLLLSRLGGETAMEATSGFLDAIAGMVRSHMASVGGMQAIGEVLFENLGFRGGDFDKAESHYLSTVLERRVGIPISLATVYVLVGRRVGLPVSGVAMPSHYVARYERPDGPLFVDCYNGGRIYRYDTLVDLLTGKGLQFSDRYLAPCRVRFTLFRMLNNLERVYVDAGNDRMRDKARSLREALQVQP